MKVEVFQLSKENLQDVNQCDGSFVVESHLVLAIENGKLTYSSILVDSYVKEYPIEEMDIDSFIDNSEKIIFIAYIDKKIAGQIDVVKWWNEYAYVNAFAVKAEYRKHGIGRALLERVIDWARANLFPGVMLETQNNNAPACALYKKCGFELSGFDKNLFKGLTPETKEVALFWYLLFNERK